MSWRRWVLGSVGLALALPAGAAGVGYWRLSHPVRAELPLPADAIAAETPEGQRLLAEAEGAADHAGLVAAFAPQEKLSWCGVASAVTVLGARGASIDQEGLFTPEASAVRSWWRVTFGGMPLADLGGLLRAHGAEVSVVHADAPTADGLREAVARNLATGGDWLIVNYDREAVGEAGGGHISPLAAWDADSDRVLLLDTAAHKYPPHWVPLERLYEAMRGVDGESGLPRGWVEVR